MNLRTLPPAVRVAAARGLEAQGRTVAGITEPRRPRKRDYAPFDSKLEVEFSLYLAAVTGCGSRMHYAHHALKLRLPGGSFYRPDFLYWGTSRDDRPWPLNIRQIELDPCAASPLPWIHTLTVYECKPAKVRTRGGALVGTKASERAQRVTMREAVPHWPWITFVVARPDGDGWQFERIEGANP